MNQELREILDDVDKVMIGMKCDRVPVYKVRVNYESGISEEFWTFKFKYEYSGGSSTYSWRKLHSSAQGPIQLNADKVESTWMLATEMLTREQADDLGYVEEDD